MKRLYYDLRFLLGAEARRKVIGHSRKFVLRQTVCRVKGHRVVIDGGVYCARHLPWMP